MRPNSSSIRSSPIAGDDLDRSFHLTRLKWHKPASNAFASQPSRAKRGLEVVTADKTVEVENLAGDIEIRHDFALHRARVDFIERHAAGRYLGLLETAAASYSDFAPLQLVDHS